MHKVLISILISASLLQIQAQTIEEYPFENEHRRHCQDSFDEEEKSAEHNSNIDQSKEIEPVPTKFFSMMNVSSRMVKKMIVENARVAEMNVLEERNAKGKQKKECKEQGE